MNRKKPAGELRAGGDRNHRDKLNRHRVGQGGENVARRKDTPIEVHAYVTVNGETVDVDTLSPEMRRRLATELQLKYLNAMFRGQAVFYAAGDEPHHT